MTTKPTLTTDTSGLITINETSPFGDTIYNYKRDRIDNIITHDLSNQSRHLIDKLAHTGAFHITVSHRTGETNWHTTATAGTHTIHTTETTSPGIGITEALFALTLHCIDVAGHSITTNTTTNVTDIIDRYRTLRGEHLRGKHTTTNTDCLRCNPTKRLFWRDDLGIVGLDSPEMWDCYMQILDEGEDAERGKITDDFIDYADECATPRGSNEEVVPVDRALVALGDEVVVAEVAGGNTYMTRKIETADDLSSLTGPVYARLGFF